MHMESDGRYLVSSREKVPSIKPGRHLACEGSVAKQLHHQLKSNFCYKTCRVLWSSQTYLAIASKPRVRSPLHLQFFWHCPVYFGNQNDAENNNSNKRNGSRGGENMAKQETHQISSSLTENKTSQINTHKLPRWENKFGYKRYFRSFRYYWWCREYCFGSFVLIGRRGLDSGNEWRFVLEWQIEKSEILMYSRINSWKIHCDAGIPLIMLWLKKTTRRSLASDAKPGQNSLLIRRILELLQCLVVYTNDR